MDDLISRQPKRTEERTETHACDCIDRQAAIDEILEWKTRMTAQGLADRIAMLPSVQPQIAHCAECRHWKHSDVRKNYCEVFDWTNTAEDFCSFAERGTNE